MKGGKGKGPGDYEVGYGKPPRHSQFTPGKSGNRNGRPTGAGGKHKRLQAFLEPTTGMILEQAYALVTVREGGRKVKVPAIQAVIMATMKSAVTGGQMSQRTYTEWVRGVEKQAAEINRQIFDRLLHHKRRCNAERKACQEAGLEEPDFLPHPDDIFLDWTNLTAEVRGPTTPEDKQIFDAILARRNGWEEDFRFNRERYEQDGGSDASLYLALESQLKYDVINENLPERYRKPLRQRIPGDLDDVAERIKRRALARKRRHSRRQRREKAADSDSPN